MTTLELNAQIADSLAEIADDENSLQKVANYLKKLISKKEEPLKMTPEIQAEIDAAEKEIAEGRCTVLRNKEEIDAFFESL